MITETNADAATRRLQTAWKDLQPSGSRADYMRAHAARRALRDIANLHGLYGFEPEDLLAVAQGRAKFVGSKFETEVRYLDAAELYTPEMHEGPVLGGES